MTVIATSATSEFSQREERTDNNSDFLDNAQIEMLRRLDRDLRSAAKLMGQAEARFLVDAYYSLQKVRIGSGQQLKAASLRPTAVLSWVHDSMKILEHDIQLTLGVFAKEYRVGRWLLSVKGIGPTIAAGLLAELDVRGRPTAGHFIRFAGLDPSVEWNSGQKRPWNASLKTLVVFKAGESFVKVQNRDGALYGKLFAERKAKELDRNRHGLNAEYCQREVVRRDAVAKRGKDKNWAKRRRWYAGEISPDVWDELMHLSGVAERERCVKKHHVGPGKGVPMLPPNHVHDRARRWVAKIFLSHLHHVMYEDYYGTEPPVPYIFAHSNGEHVHYIPVPGWPVTGGKSLHELYDEKAD